VADFGLAQLATSAVVGSAGLTGTIVHAAPEVLAGEPATAASDLYSLSSTLFCLLSGHPPFAPSGDPSLVSLVNRIATEGPPDLRSLGVPDDLCRVLEQGLAKAPADRQHDAAQFGRQIQAVQAALGQPITRLPIESDGPRPAVAPAGQPARTPRPRRRIGRRIRFAGAAALGVAAVALVTVPLAHRASALPVLYRDNFDGGTNWYEHDDETARLAYDQGRYHIEIKRPQGLVLSDTSFRGGVFGEPLTSLGDVSIRVRAQPNASGSVFGLFCRYGSTGDSYQAVVRTDGEVLILKSQPRAGIRALAHGRVADMVTGKEVDLRLDCRGGGTTHLTFFANGGQVAEATDHDPILPGSVGMLVSAEGPRADVAFDDFVLSGRPRGPAT
jgi:hypothetical protein